jgi:hypothetical protein
MHMLQGLFHLTTALHVLGVTITHPQEHKQLYCTAVTVVVGVRQPQHTQIGSNSSTIAADNNTV